MRHLALLTLLLGTAPLAADPVSIQAAVDNAVARGEKRMVIPPGKYHLTSQKRADGTSEGNWHLRFTGIRDFEIDATGATISLDSPLGRGIVFENCDNVTFRGARIERGTRQASQGTIEAVDPKGDYVDLRIDAGYRGNLEDRKLWPTFWGALYAPDGRTVLGSLRAKTPPEITQLEPDLYRIQLYDKVPSLPVAVVPGQRVAWRGVVVDDIRPMNSANLKFIDITVAGGAGMIFHEMGGGGGNLYQRCTITYPSRPDGAVNDPITSTTADGLHSHDMERGPIIEDCLFEGIGDDAIAIHGTYALVAEAESNTLVLWVFHESRDPKYCRAGEELRFYAKDGQPRGETLVESVRALPGYQPRFKPDSVYRSFQEPAKDHFVKVTLREAIPGLAPGDLISNANRAGSGYIVRNTTIRNIYARGIMAKGSGGLIEGNTIERTIRAGIEFMSEFEVWSESDYTRDTIVRGNTLRGVAFNRQPGYLRHPGAITVFNFHALTPDPDLSKRQGEYVLAPGGHRSILIENNVIEDVDGPNLLITSARGVTVRGNKFVRPMQKPTPIAKAKGVDENALIYITQASEVKLEANEVTGAGPLLKSKVVASDSVTNSPGLENGVR
jgi:hypothetical protein